MKPVITLFSILIISAITYAHSETSLDTIYANEHMNVALFFPAPIQQAIAGSEHYVFSYNREKAQHFGLLKATPGKDSNLFVIDTEGAVYGYILRYKKELSQLTYFITKTGRIGHERPENEQGSITKSTSLEHLHRETHHPAFCTTLLQEKHTSTVKRRSQGMEIQLKHVAFHNDALYFVLRIVNKTNLDFDLNFFHIGVETRKKGQRRSLQYQRLNPVYEHHVPNKIAQNTPAELVLVVPKFSISKERVVVFTMNEKHGERNLKMTIPAKFISNPN